LFEKVRSEIRRLARGLHPVFPEPIGLMTALKQLADSVSELPGICCRFDCPQPVLVPDTSTSTHLFRIARRQSPMRSVTEGPGVST
jgi:signal transduction histidine kinase